MRTSHLFASGLVLVACSGSAASVNDPPGPGAPPGTDPNATSYYRDVLPILQDHCQKCHVEGGIAPFALTTYEDAKNAVGVMVDATQKRIMPPWGAQDTSECTPPRPWKDDMRLSDAQIATLKAWQTGGTVEGDPKDAPAPRPPETTELPNASFTQTMAPYTLTNTTDTFRCFVIDPKLASTRYFNGAYFVPGNKTVVHHVLLFADPKRDSAKLADANGQYDCFGGPQISQPGLLGAWAPGGVPTELPPNAGAPVDAGTLLVMQIHYHPHGPRNDPDATKVELRFIDQKPEYTAKLALIGNFRQQTASGDGLQPGPDDTSGTQFLIPANKSGHTETMRFTMPAVTPAQTYLYGVAGHMHLVGTDEKITVDHAKPVSGAPASECLMQIPRWDFNWQRFYSYDVPIEQLPIVGPGDKLNVRCTYDNTMQNPGLLQALSDQQLSAPRDVTLGETTLDEMCLGGFTFLYKSP